MYEATVGLEIHAELKTRSKMFCGCTNQPFEAAPNTHICPVCMAHPGVLPVVNKEAVKQVLRMGVAIGGKLANYTEFDRKSYFYPDLPKGYQISQYEHPLVSGGVLAGVPVTRIHLEEDTASSSHHSEKNLTIIDYNRSGVPLMELVTEPEIHDAETAVSFARELQILLRYLGAGDANMEKGEMRVEANISIKKVGSPDQKLGTKVEVKNLNSFNSVERAIRYEIKRQTAFLEKGDVVLQETRGWDEGKQETFPQRTKEGSADYRYFPDPDIPSFRVSSREDFSLEALRGSLPELPSQRVQRYLSVGLREEVTRLFVAHPLYGDFFDKVVEGVEDSRLVMLSANYIANDLVGNIRDMKIRDTDFKDKIPYLHKTFSRIVKMAFDGKVSSRGAKDIIAAALVNEIDPEKFAQEKGFIIEKLDSGHLFKILEEVISENPRVVDDYKSGKEESLEYLLGQSMKKLKGAVKASDLRVMLKSKLI